MNRNATILILSHFYKRANQAGGPPQEMRDFWLPKVKRVVYIEHPFPYADDHRSSMTIYENGKIKSVSYSFTMTGPQALFYIMDIFITWYFLLRASFGYDLCVALDNLNTLTVLPWRWFGGIKTLVFYTIDYSPTRFTNSILNRIYLWADRVACYTADAIWILSERMTETRQKLGLNVKKSAPAYLLPMGANLERIKPLPIDKIKPYQLIFVGHLLEKQGLQLVIEALPAILAKLPKTRLVVIGQGEYEATAKDLAKKLEVNQAIEWQGFVAKHEDVEKELCRSAIGLAPYIPSPENYTYYTDPGKPKLYLGCGLPVIITGVPAIGKVIADNGAGILVQDTAKSVAEAIITVLSNKKDYARYREAALKLSAQYNTNTLIQRAVDQTGIQFEP